MIKIKCNKQDLQTKQGVYVFKNIINGKIYVGSTVMTFEKRMLHHVNRLRNGKHKNAHFQNAWNKYGEENFEYDILEICKKEDCLIREQFYLDTLLFAQDFINKVSTKFLDLGYNINPLATGTPNLSEETIEKRTKTFSEIVKVASEYYQKLKNFEIDFDDIPDKYILIVQGWYNNVPWNKGKHYESTDHLKVPKTLTKEFLDARKKVGIKQREKSKRILVFDINNNYLGKWRSPADLHEWSLTDNNNYPLILSGKAKTKELLAQNIAKACKTGKPYKGLYFKYLDDCAPSFGDNRSGEGKIGEVWDDDTELTYEIAE